MASTQNKLRSKVFGCATESERLARDDFSKAKINELRIPVLVDEAVLWLHVSVGDFLGMEIRKRVGDSDGIEFRLVVRDAVTVCLMQNREQFA